MVINKATIPEEKIEVKLKARLKWPRWNPKTP